jgi:hypothetical protein
VLLICTGFLSSQISVVDRLGGPAGVRRLPKDKHHLVDCLRTLSTERIELFLCCLIERGSFGSLHRSRA